MNSGILRRPLRDEVIHIDTHEVRPDLDVASFVRLEIRQHGLRIEAFHAVRGTAWGRQISGGGSL